MPSPSAIRAASPISPSRSPNPAPADEAAARAGGYPPGGDIMIHGLMNGFSWLGRLHRLMDWTQGCVGVTNAEMRAIYARVDVGTPIEIRP